MEHAMTQPITDEQAAWFEESFQRLVANAEKTIVGKTRVVELAFATMVSEGHLLLEDVPGTGKTALARAMSATVRGIGKRIQFTPDLLPGDVTGITVYDQRAMEFHFHEGPVFANVLLADEINRASPKTQSALLEVMEERHVTVDGVSHEVPRPFMVIATQNPVEQAGTYRLPEAQLDRFLMKTSIGYPDHASTLRILQRGGGDEQLGAVITPEALQGMTELAQGVRVDPRIADYIVRLVEATRSAAETALGASVRGALALSRASRTWAAAHGRAYVTPDDVKDLAQPVLGHRLILQPEAEFDGVTVEAVLGQILLDTVPPAVSATA
jgi:MoxR-like ATPase